MKRNAALLAALSKEWLRGRGILSELPSPENLECNVSPGQMETADWPTCRVLQVRSQHATLLCAPCTSAAARYAGSNVAACRGDATASASGDGREAVRASAATAAPVRLGSLHRAHTDGDSAAPGGFHTCTCQSLGPCSCCRQDVTCAMPPQLGAPSPSPGTNTTTVLGEAP